MDLSTIKNQTQEVKREIREKTLGYIVAALGLVAGLAWNEAIKEYVAVFIKPYFAKGSGVISLFIYAMAVTVVAVLITIQSTRVLERIRTKKV